MKYSAHDAIDHDDISNLGYDWALAGDKSLTPKRPRRVYFPETEAEVKDVFAELDGSEFRIRASAHSDNGLVTADRDVAIICTQFLCASSAADLELEQSGGDWTVSVPAGTALGTLDEFLQKHSPPLTLPVMPDHGEITVGGLLSVGGISGASFRYGLFIDNVVALDVVDANAQVHKLTRSDSEFHKVLSGLGKRGLVTTVKLRAIEFDKRNTLVRRSVELHAGPNAASTYVDGVNAIAQADLSAKAYQRSLFAFILTFPKPVIFGRIETFEPVTAPSHSDWKFRDDYIERVEQVGSISGTLQDALEELEPFVRALAVKQLQADNDFFTPEDVERLADRAIDATVGTGSLMVAMIVPAEHFADAFTSAHSWCSAEFTKGRMAVCALYSRVIESAYLAGPGATDIATKRYIDLSLYVVPGMNPATETGFSGADLVRDIAAKLDEIAAQINSTSARPALRYLCTRSNVTNFGTDNRDPNSLWP